MTHTWNTDWEDRKIAGPVVITPGEPAGIGPDLSITLAEQDFDFGIVVIADPDLLLSRAALLGIGLEVVEYDTNAPPRHHTTGRLNVLPCKLTHTAVPGKPDQRNAAYVLSSIDMAVTGCLDGSFSSIVTGPVHKATINLAGYPFTGHTEYIAARCGDAFPVMMLMNRHMRVALVTTHIPLSAVPAHITADLINKVTSVVHTELVTRFRIASPRIIVCGLNPHAGEGGYLGTEEIEEIEPAIRELRQQGYNVTGPVPADTAFTDDMLKRTDVVIAMYHDQGLPALKSHGFGETVNVTLGLPVIRTSVDHGTAFSLAGTGKADNSSLLTAIKWANILSADRS